jgi:hypothetical protein
VGPVTDEIDIVTVLPTVETFTLELPVTTIAPVAPFTV